MATIAFMSFIGTLVLALIAVGFVKLYENHKLKKQQLQVSKDKTEE